MERLGEYVDSLSRRIQLEADYNVTEEFCALVVGIGHLRDAIKKGETKEAAKEEKEEDKGESEAGKEEKTEDDDVHVIAWSVEYDLARFVG